MIHKTPEDIEIVRAMEDVPVLVVGDIMLDRFIYGKVDRISPESPVPVLSVTRENMMLGGAGNTLSNLMHLGCAGRVLSIIGDDENGSLLTKVAKEKGFDIAGLLTVEDRPTIVKTRFLAGHQQLLRTDYERIQPIESVNEGKLLDKAKLLMSDVRAVILSDYGKGMLTPGLIKSLIALANEQGVPILVDPKGKDYSIYAGADVVTPNKKELSDATGGMPVDSDEDVVKAACSLIESCGVKSVVATRSQDGMCVIKKGSGGDAYETVYIRSAEDIEVFDVSGAGDTVIATIAASMGVGADVVKAASLANVAGSIVVSKVGTAPIRAAELLERLAHHDPHGDIMHVEEMKRPKVERVRQAPVLCWNEAKEEVLRWKARGLKVGFTNGCFDILHYGHVTYLNDARAKCDRLIVGLNSDASIKLLKGESRPVHNQDARARVISALGAIDMVVFFGAEDAGEDNTPCALLEEVQPDIFFKGGDYTIDQLPEAKIVSRYGGTVDIMPVYEGHSTTSSIEKMRA